jgi:very-short-patch-repair endonuclease
MPNETSRRAAEQPAPNISADFLTGSTELGLDRIRTRLLDLTNRNKLLNFRHTTASSLRVVDVSIDQVFKRLRDNEKLSFLPVPEPDIETVEPLSAKEYAEQLEWNTSYDLDESPSESETDRSLPVLHFPEQLDTLSRKISSIARTAIEESGTNMLYLIFGFLEWYESDDSKQPHLAPLVTLPVTLERSGGKGKVIDSVIEYSGEDVETNLSLVEKMRRDFGLEMPVLEDEDSPERYFERFAEILKLKKRWRIRRQITLALLSFGKLLMYRDLDSKTWPPGESIGEHVLVRELFEGTKSANIALAEEYPIDAPELKPLIPHLIRDADSSQHSALVHALSGQNLVIEGPPGTGKSQTITNLIAAMLAKGKTVLFVSEKLAALEVVRRRLDDVGLGVFCLEVHSHKTKKGALLNDVAQRYKAHGTFRDPRELDRHLAIVEEKKRLLTRYAALINKTIEPFSATVFEILWARDRCGQDISAHRDNLGHLMLPAVVHYTGTQFTQTEQFLSVYAQHLTTVLRSCDGIDQHPWAWISKPLSFEEEERVLTFLEEFLAVIQEADECCELLQSTADITLGRTRHGLEGAARVLALLPEAAGLLVPDLLSPCQAASSRQLLAEFINHVEHYRTGAVRLSLSASDISALFDGSNAKRLLDLLQHLHQLGLDGHSVAQIRELRNTSTETARLLGDAHSSFQALLQTVGCEARADLPSVTFLLETVRLIETAPIERLHLRQAAFEDDGARVTMETAQEEATVLKADGASLGKEFDLSLGAGAYTPAQLLECTAILERSSFWQRTFGRDYRRAVKAYRSIALGRNKAPRANMIAALRMVAEHTQKRAQFDNHSSYREILGVHFRGVDSPWGDLLQLLHWYEEIFVALPEHQPQADPFRRFLFSARTERLKGIKAGIGSVSEHRSDLKQIVSHVNDFMRAVPTQRSSMNSGSFEDILACLRGLVQELTDALQAIDRLTIADDTPLREIPSILATAGQCRDEKAAVRDSRELPILLGAAFRGVDTHLEPIKNTVQYAQSIASAGLPQKTVEWLLCRDYEPRLIQLRAWLNSINNCAIQLQTATNELADISGSAFWRESTKDALGGVQALAERALANREELSQWNHFLRLRIESRDKGLEKLTALADARTLEPKELVLAYHFVFYNTLARSVFAEHAELSQMTGVTQELLRQQFAWADKEAIRLYSERVAALIDQRPVPFGNQSGPVRTWTEMALIINEINKQKRHIPIRQLMRRADSALVALKPCFMMGPLSVAQYLAPGQLKFDLVVMDEASQLKPEDAIGALARGGQVVIVGDPKQLPPTSFFQRVSLDPEDDDEDSRTAVEEGESILDVASTLFQPVRRLRWHYRSRHHSLIAFSNNEFYGDLVVFPSAYHDDPSLGVKHHFVSDGMFENSRNPREAAVVVEAVLEHMREHPHESLGVVTMNFEQRELVEELLDRRLRDDPAAVAYQERMTGGQETFFVKNLENVQGDERDVIFISTTYGPDARGNQFQRFGPINGPNGHRRLNVLFTRAKKRVLVFSSLDPDRIQTTANSPWGLRALKQYLIFARTGILQQPNDGLEQPTNDFERSVGTVLKEKGYDVVAQVGVAGFFIDLGVKHPAKSGTFLLGIECDGASYHSGRSARDRDRLRQEILENLGWKIHRIWSTDWFKSRDSEIKRLIRHIEDLLATDPAFRAVKDKVNKAESLRQRLIMLRESEIKPAFPESPAETGLLRKSLLEEFVRTRPKTKDDWFRKLPQHLRTSVDSKQVGKYLDRVLEIIAESEE